MSLFPLIFAGGILTFALLHTKKIEMQRTNIQGELKLLLNEKGVWKQQISVKQSQIDAFSLQNAHLGAKSLWIPGFAIHISYCFIDGGHLLFNEFAYGSGILVGIMYIITGITQLFGLGLLLFAKEYKLRIFLKDSRREVELNFYPPRNATNFKERIQSILQFGTKMKAPKDEGKISTIENGGFTLLLALGIGFPALAILSQVFKFFSGIEYGIVLILTGILYLTKYIKHYKPLNDKGTEMAKGLNVLKKETSSQEIPFHHITQENDQYFYFLLVHPKPGEENKKVLTRGRVNPLTLLLEYLLVFFSSNLITSIFWYTPNLGEIRINIVIDVVLGIFVIGGVFWHQTVLERSLIMVSDTNTYLVYLKGESLFSHLKKWKEFSNEFKIKICARIVGCVISILSGIVFIPLL